MPSTPTVISVILNTNRRADTLECLSSLARGSYSNHRTIVLDNASTDGSVEAIQAQFPEVQVISLERNLGYTGNNNVGIREAINQGADWVFVLNEDTLVAEDCLAQLVSVVEGDPGVGIAGPLVYHHDEPTVIQSAGGQLDKHWLAVHIGQNEQDRGQYSQPARSRLYFRLCHPGQATGHRANRRSGRALFLLLGGDRLVCTRSRARLESLVCASSQIVAQRRPARLSPGPECDLLQHAQPFRVSVSTPCAAFGLVVCLGKNRPHADKLVSPAKVAPYARASRRHVARHAGLPPWEMGNALGLKMKILFLSTWFPYPPNQGSKIRAYYLLKALSARHEVALVTFEDVDLDPIWVEHIRQLCSRVEIVRRKPFAASTGKTLLGWLSPLPSAVVAIHSPEMAEQVSQIAQTWKPEVVVALTFVTAPYALAVPEAIKVIDIDNFMARMLKEAIPLATGPVGRFRRHLAYKKFLRYERYLYPKFDLCLAVTQADREAVLRQMALRSDQIVVIPNGVDTQYNHLEAVEPVPNTLVFNGALTYNANYDAMSYFLREIYPLIIQQVPDVCLRVTGSTAGVDIGGLPIDGHVELTGYLPDIRPTVAQSWVCVVPLRMGGGTRLKILEAMSLGTPVVSTTKGAEGLEVEDSTHLLLADTPDEFARQVIHILQSTELRERLRRNAENLVSERYEWSQIGADFCAAVEQLLAKNGSKN